MKKILKVILIICIIFLGFIIYAANSMTDNPVLRMMIIGFAIGILLILGTIYILPIILLRKKAQRDLKMTKLSKEDIIKNKTLYREILKEYSPAILSYIDNMEYNHEITIISVLLNLKLKGLIKENENGIVKIEDYKNVELDNIEKLIFNNIKYGKVIVEKEKLKDVVIEESSKKKVVEANLNNKELLLSKAKKIVILFVILFVALILSIQMWSILTIFLFMIVTSYPILAIIYLISYNVQLNKNPIFRTENGREINRKLEGLKNFIREYSMLDSKMDQEVYIWEEFLIYSVIFEQNQIIRKQYSKYF